MDKGAEAEDDVAEAGGDEATSAVAKVNRSEPEIEEGQARLKVWKTAAEVGGATEGGDHPIDQISTEPEAQI